MSVAVLGVNAAHDAAACLLVGGRVVAAIAEERLTRSKRHEGYPHLAVAYCLREGGFDDLNGLDAVVINEYVRNDYGLDVRQAGYRNTLRLIHASSGHRIEV